MRGFYTLTAALLIGCGGGGAAPLEPGASNPDTPGTPAPPQQSPPSNTTPPPAPPPSSGTAAPMTATITTSDRYFVQTDVRIAVGGTVTFIIDDNHHDITFSPLPAEGNILEIEEGESATRTFPVAGTYTFRCDRHGDGGTIHVESTTSTPPTPPLVPTPPAGPAATITTPGVSFAPSTVTINVGQSVVWQITGARHNVTFRGAQPTGGNIPDTEAGNSVSRTFTTAGTYPYDCTRHSGMSGTVIVQ